MITRQKKNRIRPKKERDWGVTGGDSSCNFKRKSSGKKEGVAQTAQQSGETLPRTNKITKMGYPTSTPWL